MSYLAVEIIVEFLRGEGDSGRIMKEGFLTMLMLFKCMLDENTPNAQILTDKWITIRLIDRLLNDLLTDTSHLPKGASPFHCKDSPSISVGDYLQRTTSLHRHR